MRAVVNARKIQAARASSSPSCRYQVNPDNLAIKNRRGREGRQARRHRRHPRRDVGPHRSAPRHRAEARRGRRRSSSTTCTSTRSCRRTSAEHARDRRRGAPHPSRSTGSSPPGSTTRSTSSSADPVPAARGEKRSHIPAWLPQGPRRARRGHALIRRSPDAEEARSGLMELLDVDEIQARAILELQLRVSAALERQKIHDEAEELDGRSPTSTTSSRSPSGSVRSSSRSSTRSSRASGTTAAARSCSASTATCRSKTSSPRRRWSSPSPPGAVRQAHPERQLPVAAPRWSRG